LLGGGTKFDLADSVQVDRADANVVAQLERVQVCLNDHQWEQAVETLRQAAGSSPGKLIAVTPQRFITVRQACQIKLAGLPPEALKLYRDRVDAEAQRCYEEGVRTRDRRLLNNVVRQTFASSWGDKALMALGELSLEAGDFAQARWCWERILPAPKAENKDQALDLANWPGYPDSTIDPATVRARLVLVSILEGSQPRAKAELAAFVRMHGEARGHMQGREVVYATLLAQLLAQSDAWQGESVGSRQKAEGSEAGAHLRLPELPAAYCPPPTNDWPTFAGDSARNGAASELTDAASVAWRLPLGPSAPAKLRHPLADDWISPLSYYPAVSDKLLFVGEEREIIGIRADSGAALWDTHRPVIYREALDTPGINFTAGSEIFGVPRHSLTIAGQRLYARMGSPATSWPQAVPGPRLGAASSGYLICIDLAGEGKLLWKTTIEESWAIEGAPVVSGEKVYVVMRRNEIRPQVHVACFDAPTGKLRWRQFVAAAETPGRSAMLECWHDLLTLAGDTLYVNTNLGAVAALNADDGMLAWVTLYPRDRQGDLLHLAPHWHRDMNPCVFDRGTLLVAPADTSRLLAIDAATGQFLWQSGSEVEDILHLLGTTNDHLVASGKRLYWINLRGPNAGRIAHYWPQTEESIGYGRGVLTPTKVLWPSRQKLYIFDSNTAEQKKVIDLAAIGASGGNILIVGGRLIIATATELIGISPTPVQHPAKNELTGDTR
jgi:outer membrane protein assembly factor BamB